MGPGSDNPGYGPARSKREFRAKWLQWVQGPITLVMVQAPQNGVDGRLASMGPGSDNPGYVGALVAN